MHIKKFFLDTQQKTIFTPNPEMLVAAHTHPYFSDILNSSSLNICDGRGIEFALWRKVRRLSGIDAMLLICATAQKEGRSIYLVGSGKLVIIESAVEALRKLFPRLMVVGCHPGPQMHVQQQKESGKKIGKLQIDKDVQTTLVHDIILAAPDILFVGFGHEKQELWIHETLAQLPSVRVAMGVGGAFDILSGTIRRAPRLLRRYGLEWLWRLLREPWRIGRIWTAVAVFPYLVWCEKLQKN